MFLVQLFVLLSGIYLGKCKAKIVYIRQFTV